MNFITIKKKDWYIIFLPVSQSANYVLAFVYLPNVDLSKVDFLQTCYHKSVKEKWPLFYEALVHSGDNNCYKPTFLRVADKYLGLSIRLDNVGVSDFDKSYSNEKVNELFSYAFNMIKELEEHEITLFDKAKGIW